MRSPAASWTGPIYLDASALVKLFVPEGESESLNRALVGRGDVIISDLALTEMASALGRRAREGSLDRAEAERLYDLAWRLRESSLAAELSPAVHRRAERLMLSSEPPLRALDALHLASALDSRAQTLVTFDSRLRVAARSRALFVAP